MTPTPERLRRDRFLELLRFATVGVGSTLLYLGVYSVAVLEGVPYGLSSLIGWAISVAFGFVAHHRFTFRTGHEGAFTGDAGIWRWISLQVLVLLLNFAGLSALVHGAGISRIGAQLILLPLIPLLSYVLSRRFIFKPPASEPLRVPTALSAHPSHPSDQ